MKKLDESLKDMLPLDEIGRDPVNSDILIHELRDFLVRTMNE